MKWFKHYADARHSRFLSKLKQNTGREGLCRYWELLEFLCEKFDGKDFTFVVPNSVIRQLLGFRSYKHQQFFADQLASIPGSVDDQSAISPGSVGDQSGTDPGLIVHQSANDWRIEAPILLDLLGRDFKAARSERAKAAPKNKNKNRLDSSLQIANDNDSQLEKNLKNKKQNSTQKFDFRFSKENLELTEFFAKYELNDLSKLNFLIIEHFVTLQTFYDWVAGVEQSFLKNKTSGAESGNSKTYFRFSLKSELGLLRDKKNE